VALLAQDGDEGGNTPSEPRKAIEGRKNGKRGNDDDIWISRFFICGF
jgi:hypothetical protein